MSEPKKCEIAAYYFPNYHPDARNAKWHGKGWTEWELVRAATPRYEGHYQPRVPVWGYEDESDPIAMAKKIDAAADNGLTAFIFDWYWYEDGPFLQRGLEDGFLEAANNDRLKFSLMWANHTWLDIHPATRSHKFAELAKGEFSPAAFEAATDHMIEKYFSHPSYWRVNGGLYLSIYQLTSLVQSLGGVESAKIALEKFRAKVRAKGLGELHLNAVVWGVQILPGETMAKNPDELVHILGFDSVTSYIWVHFVPLREFPTISYSKIVDDIVNKFEECTNMFTVPYFPNVTVGWDSSPRTIQTDVFDNLGYPHCSILDGNTPAEFERACKITKNYVGSKPDEVNVITVNAWNEWTEGSYLEPDMKTGMAYLDAIKKVFAPGRHL